MGLLPETKRGRRTPQQQADHDRAVEQFAELVLEIDSTLDFKVGSRGWCYILEQHGLDKGDFDKAQRLINECRKNGVLPIDICADDDARQPKHLLLAGADPNPDELDDIIEQEVEKIEEARDRAIQLIGVGEKPFDFWYSHDVYVEMLVEKIDLRELFGNVCGRFCIPISNSRGWPDINSRRWMMERFREMESRGKQCVLLYCGDFDPAGLVISDSIRKMFADLSDAVGWTPDSLIVDRFGLNADFIVEHGLSWIDGLETSSGRRLDSPKHGDFKKPYVQNYLKEFGARKVEANALVTQPEVGRRLALEAICKYVPEDAPEQYKAEVSTYRYEIRKEVLAALEDAA